MTRSRILIAAIATAITTGAVLAWADHQPLSLASPEATRSGEMTPPTTTTTIPLMDPEVLELYTAETQIIDDATVATTTTSPSTTTTVATTTTQAAPATTAAKSSPTTSPPTTQAPTTTAPSGGYDSGAESQFASNINSYRASNGLAALARSGSLDSYARSWAKHMAEAGSLSHSDIGSLLGEWSAVGENVGVGGSVSSVFDALVASAPHRENMLGDFTHFGIGVYRDSSGALWTAHVFAR